MRSQTAGLSSTMQARKAAVIGPGRVGKALSKMYSPPAQLIGRSFQPADWQQAVIERVPSCCHSSLIFIQNGMLGPWLKRHNLQHNTQVLLYMSADGSGNVTDGGQTAACGPYAEHVAAVLKSGGVQCQVLQSWQDYHKRSVAKLLWATVFWMLSAALGGKQVGRIALENGAAVRQLVEELLPVAYRYLANEGFLEFPEGPDRSAEAEAPAVTEQLVKYSLRIGAAVPSDRMAYDEFAWRNGFFLAQQATPHHLEWLFRAGCPQRLLQEYGVTVVDS